MPTYSYACTECGHRFDAVQSFTDANLTECPTCSGRLRKLFNSVGIVFKGSGFYRTDSRAGAVEAAAKKEKGDAKAAGNGSADTNSKSTDAKSTGSDTAKKSDGATKSSESASSSPSNTKTNSAKAHSKAG